MDKLIKIVSLEDYQKAIQGKAILVFSATWCPDCTFMKSYIEEIVNENKDFVFYYVDRDEMTDLCIDLEIMGIPSFVAYKDGKETGRFVSKLRKTKAEVQKFIDDLSK